MTSSVEKTPHNIPTVSVILENLSDAVYLIDPVSSNILWVNRVGYESLGMAEEEVLNASVLSLQQNVTDTTHWSSIAETIKSSGSFTFLGHHRCKDGSELPVEVNTTYFVEGNRDYFVSIARDISNRMAAESASQSTEKQLWFALNACSDGLWDWNTVTDSVYFSPQLKRMLGYGQDEMPPVVDTWKNGVHPDDLPHVFQALDEHLQGKRNRYEAVYRLKNRNGHYLWVHDLGSISERDMAGNPVRVIGMVKDITDYKQQEFRLLELAAYDELTGLRNRRECSRIFDKQLQNAVRHQQSLSICLFDFDHFKTVNDRLGHLAGDFVLQETATLLNQNIRQGDFLFRWGGEEFMLICPNTSADQATLLAEKLRTSLENQVLIYQGEEIRITGSFGISSYSEHGNESAELLLAADSALYQAKSAGRNRVAVAVRPQTSETADSTV